MVPPVDGNMISSIYEDLQKIGKASNDLALVKRLLPSMRDESRYDPFDCLHISTR